MLKMKAVKEKYCRKDGKARPAKHELLAKEAAAVDTLKKKLE